MNEWRRGGELAVLILALGAASAWGQTDVEVDGGVQLNLSTPGARSLGMGGAGVALEGDPALAFSNPGGLTTLTRPEISVEGRLWQNTSLFTDHGRLGGTPSGNGIDTVSGLVDGRAKSDDRAPSSAFLVVPAGHFAFAAFYVTNTKFDTSYHAQGAFTGPYRLFPTFNQYALEIKDYGAAVAYRIGRIASIGASAVRYEMTLSSLTERYNFTATCTACDQVGEAYGPANFAANNINTQQTQNGVAAAWVFTYGFTEKFLGDKLTIGFAYRKGPQFHFEAITRGGTEFNNADTILARVGGTLHLPDILSMGASVRPGTTTTLAFEYRRVRYSLLIDGFAMLSTYPSPAPQPADFKSDDANEFHLGFEQRLGGESSPVAVRLGGWYDPEHGVYFSGDPSIGGGLPAARFRKRDGVYHGSGGLGATIGGHLVIDAAVDVSTRVTTASVSAGFRF